MQENGGDYTMYMPVNDVDVNLGGGTYRAEFTMQEPTDYNARLTFNFGDNNSPGGGFPAVVGIDNVVMQEVQTGNMITNSDFANGDEGWSKYTHWSADSSITLGGEFETASIRIHDGGSENWHTQITQSGLNIVKGKTYKLSFYTTHGSKPPTGTIEVIVEENGGDYTEYMQPQLLESNPGDTIHEVVFTMTENTDSNARLTFNFGLEQGRADGLSSNFSIDDVSLTEVTSN